MAARIVELQSSVECSADHNFLWLNQSASGYSAVGCTCAVRLKDDMTRVCGRKCSVLHINFLLPYRHPSFEVWRGGSALARAGVQNKFPSHTSVPKSFFC